MKLGKIYQSAVPRLQHILPNFTCCPWQQQPEEAAMYIVAKLINRNRKDYRPNGKDKGKGPSLTVTEEREDSIDYQTLRIFQTEEEAQAEGKRRLEESPYSKFLIFMAIGRFETEKPAVKYVDLVV